MVDNNDLRVKKHPILEVPDKPEVKFYWEGRKMTAKEGEVISSALFANGVKAFGFHTKDHAPQSLFCANGQCSQCLVIADGKPVKGCMVAVQPGMRVEPVKGLPELPPADEPLENMNEPRTVETDVLVIGGGPAGLSAAHYLGGKGINVLLVDDKDRLGGKLVLQTHKFFGSKEDCYAGTRGIDIGTILEGEVRKHDSVEVWLNSTVLAVFEDKKVGVIYNNEEYVFVVARNVLVATGAREKNLVFPGNTLPGVIGAGAFQTLVNRDLVKPCNRLFIVGGGNVGLIAGYHAIQAGIDVVGLVEALPRCGGYKVHEDKLRKLGVPIFTSHTILGAQGEGHVHSVTIAQVDEKFQPIAGTEKSYDVDMVLVAVGLEPIDQFYHKARAYGMEAWTAGDAKEIAEASAAIFSGKIEAMKIARSLGLTVGEVPTTWVELQNILKTHPGEPADYQYPEAEEGVFPVFHCFQDIPCSPCTSVCPIDQIETVDGTILSMPYFKNEKECIGCGQCVAICPGLAVTLVDYRKDPENPTVTLPWELGVQDIQKGDNITVLNDKGEELGDYVVEKVRQMKKYKTALVHVKIPKEVAKTASGIKVQAWEITRSTDQLYPAGIPNDAVVCRCERVTAREVREWIRKGVRDVNEMKGITRAGMGACGGTCESLIYRLFREEGVALDQVTPATKRPLFVEVPLGVFAEGEKKGGK